MKTRVALCDDFKIVREGLRQIINNTPDFVVNAEFANGEELIDAVRKLDTDILLLDISLPGRSGLDTLKEVKVYKAELPILILSMFPEDQYAIRMLRAGASGYLHKDSAPEELFKAIKHILAGNTYYSDDIAQLLVQQAAHNSEKLPHENLSDREFEVMVLIGRGVSPVEIAKVLFLSIKTVSTYRTRIMNKMGLKNNADLIKYLVSHKLLDT